MTSDERPALARAVESLFAGTGSAGWPSVGIELELIPFRYAGSGQPETVAIAELRQALAGLTDVTFEPGGQIELNPPPQPTVQAACDAVAALSAAVHRRLDTIGVDVVAAGLNPWHRTDELGLQLTSERYIAMDRYLGRRGPAGRSFMRQTASTQICVDLASGPAGMAQWHVANLVAPVLAAIFANGPFHEGRAVGHNGGRTAICRAVDPARSGHGRFPACADAVADYVRFAAGAAPISADYVGPGTATRHLSTLFPPVRPRGSYLEIRSIDSLAIDDLRTAADLTAALLVDATARDEAAAVLAASSTSAQLWDMASGVGVRARCLREIAGQTIGIAEIAAHRLGGYLTPGAPERLAGLRHRVARGVAPGDQLRWGGHDDGRLVTTRG